MTMITILLADISTPWANNYATHPKPTRQPAVSDIPAVKWAIQNNISVLTETSIDINTQITHVRAYIKLEQNNPLITEYTLRYA